MCVLLCYSRQPVQNIPLKRLQDRHNKKRQFAHQKLQIGIWNKVKTFQTKLVYKCKWYFWPKSILCWCPLGACKDGKFPMVCQRPPTLLYLLGKIAWRKVTKNLHLPPFNFSPLEQIVLITEGALAVVKVQMIKYQKNSLISEDVIALRELHSYTV